MRKKKRHTQPQKVNKTNQQKVKSLPKNNSINAPTKNGELGVLPIQTEKENKQKKPIWRDALKYLKNIGMIGGLVVTILFLYDRYWKSDREKYVEENIPHGTLKSPKLSETISRNNSSESYKVLNQKPSLVLPPVDMGFPKVPGIHIDGLSLMPPKDSVLVLCGRLPRKICVQDLYQGIGINFCKGGGEIFLLAENDRLYASVEFRDIESQMIIGKLSFNHWEIYKGKFSNYQYDDTRFEVFDPEGYIAFSIAYSPNYKFPFVAIAGYLNTYNMISTFVNSDSITNRDSKVSNYFIPCIDKSSSHWKADAYNEIINIKSIFDPNAHVRLYDDSSYKILRKK